MIIYMNVIKCLYYLGEQWNWKKNERNIFKEKDELDDETKTAWMKQNKKSIMALLSSALISFIKKKYFS